LNASQKTIIISVSGILFVVALLIGYVISTSSSEQSEKQTISQLQTVIGSLQSHPVVSVSTQTQTVVSISVSTSVATNVVTRFPNVPWDNIEFMSPLSSGCTGTGPCHTFDLGQAVVFPCVAAAATLAGCTEQVNGTAPSRQNFTITIWNPYPLSQTSAKNDPFFTGANCAYSIAGTRLDHVPAYCAAIGSSYFIVVEKLPGLV